MCSQSPKPVKNDRYPIIARTGIKNKRKFRFLLIKFSPMIRRSNQPRTTKNNENDEDLRCLTLVGVCRRIGIHASMSAIATDHDRSRQIATIQDKQRRTRSNTIEHQFDLFSGIFIPPNFQRAERVCNEHSESATSLTSLQRAEQLCLIAINSEVAIPFSISSAS